VANVLDHLVRKHHVELLVIEWEPAVDVAHDRLDAAPARGLGVLLE
jgi:hypothetical protein